MYFTFGLLFVVLLQTQPPPASKPPANNPWAHPNNKQLPPNNAQPPSNQSTQPGQQTGRPNDQWAHPDNKQLPQPNDPTGQTGPGYPFQFGTMHQMPVDGTYQVLAYEKFGQMLPGMNNVKIVIRQSILHFPGDTKTPGKMMRLTFGANNTIMITPLDGRTDPVPPVNSQPPVANNQNRQLTQPPAGGNNATVPPGQPQRDSSGQNVNQAGYVPPGMNSEWGVYVLSGEYFSIAVIGGWPLLHQSRANQSSPSDNRSTRTGGADTAGQQPGYAPNLPRGPGTPMPPGAPGNGTSRATIVLRRIAN